MHRTYRVAKNKKTEKYHRDPVRIAFSARRMLCVTLSVGMVFSAIGCSNPNQSDDVSVAPPLTESSPSKSTEPVVVPEILGTPTPSTSGSIDPSPLTNRKSDEKRSADNAKDNAEKAQAIADDAEEARVLPPIAKSVELSVPVPAGPKALMKIETVSVISAEADGIGQVSGEALVIELSIENSSTNDLDLARSEISVYFGKELVPSTLLSDPRTKDLVQLVKPGQKVQAKLFYSAQVVNRSQVTVHFSSGNEQEIQQLTGKVKL